MPIQTLLYLCKNIQMFSRGTSLNVNIFMCKSVTIINVTNLSKSFIYLLPIINNITNILKTRQLIKISYCFIIFIHRE